MIPLVKVNLPEKELLLKELEQVLYNEPINEGQRVYKFESELSQKLKTDNLLSVNSGTSALHIALILSSVQPGDVVLSTSLTAEPTNTVIKSTGASIRYIDADPLSGMISLESLQKVSLENVKAMIIVHYGGYVQPLDEIAEFCSSNNIKLIEDCAHALFAKYKNRFVGSFGDFGCFSFQAIKQITTIEGGALQIKDQKLVQAAKEIRWFGLDKNKERGQNNIQRQGYKYNYNNVHAAIGLLQLETFDLDLNGVRDVAARYNALIDQLKNLSRVIPTKDSEPAFWLYCLMIGDTDKAIEFFERKGIAASKIHKLNHHHDFLSTGQVLEGTETFYKNMVHIPIGPWLGEHEVQHILNSLKELDELYEYNPSF